MKSMIWIAAFALLIVGSAARAQEDGYIRADRLGINHISSLEIPDDPTRYEQALALGAGWNRFPMYWDRVEQPSGSLDWSGYDKLIETDLNYGLKINLILMGIPAVHRDGEGIRGLNEPIFTDGTDSPAGGKAINPANPWAMFVFRAAMRYMPNGDLARERGWTDGRGVTVWEIWNEPDYRQFWSAGVTAYARLLKVAYLVIHALDPDATVMLGGLLYPTADNWLARVLNIFANDPMARAHNYFVDAAAVHAYSDSYRSAWLTLYARQTFVEFGLERPIWLNESGVPIWNDYPGPTWAAEDDSLRQTRARTEEQAWYLIQSAAYGWAQGAQVIFFFQLYDDCGNQPAGTNFPPHDGALCTAGQTCYGDAFGMYRNQANSVCFAQHPQPGTARPVAQAFRLLADVFGTIPFSPRGVITLEFGAGVMGVIFSRPATDERVIVLWNERQRPVTAVITAQGDGADLVTLNGRERLAPVDGSYRIALSPALNPALRDVPAGHVSIGGEPVIVIERQTPQAAVELRRQTYANVVGR